MAACMIFGATFRETLEIANQNPDALIIVTGGVPQNNKTEGDLMEAMVN